MIGLSRAGKTTLSKLLYEKLKPQVNNLVLLDGDTVRELFRNDVGLIVNCLGKIQQREDATKKNETGTELGHILNGEEVRIMQTVNHFIGKENMLAVVFDG